MYAPERALMRETLRKASWSALTLVMFLAFLEILCRRTDPATEDPHVQMDFDADLMWGLRNEPHLGREYRVNSLGLRGDELSDADGLRILTLGDSSIYGHGVRLHEVFSSVLATRIAAARPAPPVEAVIGGVPGYSTFQSRRLFDRVAAAVEPDVVVIGNLWSDSFGSAISDRAWAEELAAAYGPWQPLVAPLSAVSRHSALARRLRSTVHGAFFPEKRTGNEVGWSHLVPSAPGGPPRRLTVPEVPTYRVPVDEYRANLEAMVAAIRAAGALPTFLLLPHPLDATTGLPASDQQYRDTMRAVAAAAGAPLVDGPAWFAAHPARGRRFTDDIHPDAEGHAQLGEAVLSTFAADPTVAERLALR